jgi:flagellar M-ring protein FliF
MAADNPSLPNPGMAAGLPVPMGGGAGNPNGAPGSNGANGMFGTAGGGASPNGAGATTALPPGANSVGAAAVSAAQAAQAAAAQAAAAVAGGAAGLKRTIENIPAVQQSPTVKMIREALNQQSVKKAVPGLIAFFVLVLFLVLYSMMQPPATPPRALMPGMSETDSQAAVEALKSASFDVKVDPQSGNLMVPGDKYHEARIFLASKGIPKQPLPTGIDSLSKENAMTTSQFMEQVRYIKALENELASSVMQIGTIQAARVHLALPKQSVFVRDRALPKASVVVTPQQGRAVTSGQVDAIVHLVSSSVPYLAAQHVSVVDNLGNLLTDRKENTPMGMTSAQLTHKQHVEEVYRARILEMLIPVLGEPNVRSQVDVTLDFTQVEMATEDFDNAKTGPKTRSEVLAEDRSQKINAEGVPGSITNAPPPPTDTNLATGASAQDALEENTTLSKRATRNYEIDKTVRYIRNPLGGVTRVSVAVVVNEKPAMKDADGKPIPHPNDSVHGYSAEELERLTNLVRGVVGYKEGRGDVVTIVPTRFAPGEEAKPWYADDAVMQNMKILIAALIFLIILLTVVRPVINHLTGKSMDMEEMARMQAEQEAAELAALAAIQAPPPAALLEGQGQQDANGVQLGPDGQPLQGVQLGPDGQPLPADQQATTELSEAEMGMIEIGEGESLEEIKAKLKPKKSSISIDMLNTANSYDDKVALIRFLVSEDSGRVATVLKNMMRPAAG